MRTTSGVLVGPIILAFAGLLIATGAFSVAMYNRGSKAAHSNETVAARQAFQQWRSLHNKIYSSPAEEAHRFENFLKAFNRVKARNAAFTSFTSGLNKFSDLSKEEFKANYLGYKPVANSDKSYDYSLLEATPSNDKDWRTVNGVVTPVKDQGQCGSCWAFSATGSLEGVAQISGKQTLSFSEQQLVDCSSKYGNEGCDGGLMNQAFDYVIANGIETEAMYPYTARDGKCSSKTGVYKITGYKNVPIKSSPALSSACDIQPVSIAIEADEIMDYTGGVFDDKSCGDSLDHGVLLVGYTSSYWIVKNSWGNSWGEQGFIRMSRSAIPDKQGGICGILMASSYPTQ